MLNNGFTLVELVIVIVLLSIIAVVSTQFFTTTIIGYNDASIRTELSHIGRIAVEKLNRELRNALPQSLRVSGNCIEFIPIISSASYQDQNITYTSPAVASMPLAVNGQSSANNLVDVFNLNFNEIAATNYFVTVYPIGPGSGNTDAYGGTNPGPLVAYTSKSFVNPPTNTITRLQLSVAYLFTHHSPTRRLYITLQPVSFCVIANRLNRYQNYGISLLQATPPAVLAQRIVDDIQLLDGATPITPFTYLPGSLVRNAVVKLDLRLMKLDHLGNSNWSRMDHEVQIRNVP